MYNFRPSKSHWWVNCPGFFSIHKGNSSSNNAAIRGSSSHWYAEELLIHGEIVDELPQGLVIDDEIKSCAEQYVDFVEPYMDHQHFVENSYRMSIDRIVIQGTPDFVSWDDATKTITVIDYKFGMGKVDAKNNYQLLIYAMMVRLTVPMAMRFKFIIVQPRYYKRGGISDEWYIGLEEFNYHCKIVTQAVANALLPNPVFKTGNHCKNCDNLIHCSSARLAGLNAVDFIDRNTDDEIPNDKIKIQLENLTRAIEAAKIYKTALENLVINKIENGESDLGLIYQQIF